MRKLIGIIIFIAILIMIFGEEKVDKGVGVITDVSGKVADFGERVIEDNIDVEGIKDGAKTKTKEIVDRIKNSN